MYNGGLALRGSSSLYPSSWDLGGGIPPRSKNCQEFTCSKLWCALLGDPPPHFTSAWEEPLVTVVPGTPVSSLLLIIWEPSSGHQTPCTVVGCAGSFHSSVLNLSLNWHLKIPKPNKIPPPLTKRAKQTKTIKSWIWQIWQRSRI